MNVLSLDVLDGGEAQEIQVVAVLHPHRHQKAGVGVAFLDQVFDGAQAALAGDDLEQLAVLGLLHPPNNEVLQDTLGRDGLRQFFDGVLVEVAPGVHGRMADLVERHVLNDVRRRVHGLSPW